MLDILLSLLETVSLLVSFVINFISSLLQLISRIPYYSYLLVEFLTSLLPPFILPFVAMYIIVVTFQYVINRKAG